MKKLFFPALLALTCAQAGAVTVTLDADLLKNADGTPMPVTGLIVLTAGLSGSFAGPGESAFAGTGELVLQKWDLSAFNTPGVFSGIAANLQLGNGWDQGDPLRFYWYPTLTLGSAFPGFGTPYGFYQGGLTSTGLDGSDAWLTPAASDTISLKFFTSDGGFLHNGGSNPAGSGTASQTVIPEPSTATLLLGGAAALGLLRRRRR